jgi:conjugal transfer/entry exclusion protein
MKRLRMLAMVSILTACPVLAQEPVIDAAANASLVTQIAQGAKELGMWAEQIQNMVELVTLQNIAGEVLGEAVGGEFTQLIDAASSLYNDASGLYGTIASMQARWESQIGVFMPPPGGYGEMTTWQLINKARQMQRLLTQGTAQVQLAQSKLIDRQAAYMKEAMAGGAQADRARSAVSATQAAAHILAAQAAQLEALNHTLGTMAMTIENKILTDEARLEMAQEMRAKDVALERTAIAAGAGEMTISPIQWGR